MSALLRDAVSQVSMGTVTTESIEQFSSSHVNITSFGPLLLLYRQRDMCTNTTTPFQHQKNLSRQW